MYIRVPQTYILFLKSWLVHSAKGVAVAAVASFLAAACSEALDTYKTKLERTVIREKEVPRYRTKRTKLYRRRILLSTIYQLLKTLRYLLMMVAMTYDIVLLTAVIAGAGVGYFLTNNLKRHNANPKYTSSLGGNHSQENENSSLNEALPIETTPDQFTVRLIRCAPLDDV